ncbi:MAG: type II toxin-antitoxin system VapC family toxin [Planctomycetaceae bacterium]|nr:type II toxin-antitoxin system VapC family toxin [Planctomycetaceae bacterium]
MIGHLASRPSVLLVTAANQQVSHEFWNDHRSRFDLFISQAVLDECAAGDEEAALERADLVTGLPLLDINNDVASLATDLMSRVPLPSKAILDAVHIAVAAVHGIDYLVTWNCKHIANPALRGKIELVCRSSGFQPPVICTPLELIEVIP